MEGIAQQMDAMAVQIDELTRTTVMWMVISTLLLIFLFVILLVVLRIKRRNSLLQAWLERELQALGEGQAALLQHRPATAAQRRPGTPAAAPTSRPKKQPERKAKPLDLTAMVNEMLAGSQPYNLFESLRAMEPGLPLQRLTPGEEDDPYSGAPVLEPGGDGLFALIRGDQAQLYPNYGRFSATLDPRPYFDGVRHGGRIQAVLQPARLRKQADGTWAVQDRGRVQMRQGS